MTQDEALNVLGLNSGASRAEISAAYRELAQMMHPDKFGDNRRLRDRAERQMSLINQARDILLKGAKPSRTRSSSGKPTADSLAFEAQARARAAETARLAVVTQMRTMRERRRGMVTMALIAAVILVVFRFRGVSSVASMFAFWGIIDAVMLTNQISIMQKRSRELLDIRNRAEAVAQEAKRL